MYTSIKSQPAGSIYIKVMRDDKYTNVAWLSWRKYKKFISDHKVHIKFLRKK